MIVGKSSPLIICFFFIEHPGGPHVSQFAAPQESTQKVSSVSYLPGGSRFYLGVRMRLLHLHPLHEPESGIAQVHGAAVDLPHMRPAPYRRQPVKPDIAAICFSCAFTDRSSII